MIKPKLSHYKLQFQIKIESSSGGDDKPITPPNKEENKGNETSEKHENGTSEEQNNETPEKHENGTSEETSNKTDNKQQDDRNTDKHLPNTGHKEDPTQTVGIVLLLAGLLSILATKRKKIINISHPINLSIDWMFYIKRTIHKVSSF